MPRQTTSTLLMIRPEGFRMNEQTAVNNYYQKVLDGLGADKVSEAAEKEFDRFVDVLQNKGVQVVVIQDTPEPSTPDAVFPNNWVSFHHDGRVALYPMFAENRRQERREDIFDELKNHYGLQVNEIIDFTEFEDHSKYLEGTGSMILDRANRIAYAALSDRTDRRAFELFCEVFDYVGVIFEAFQNVKGERKPIYHTNVMMCVANHFAIVCLDSIDDPDEREMLTQTLRDSGKEIISITEEQTQRFAGNMLEVANTEEKPLLVMSTSAYEALEKGQIDRIEKHCEIVHSSLDTIEACGGGSARCMMAEVFLPKI